MNTYKYYSLLVMLCLYTTLANSQQLTPTVMSTGGGFYQNSAGMLSFTTGEMSAISTLSANEFILTQGFQQIWDLGTAITDPGDLKMDVSVFPNPSSGMFMVETQSEFSGEVDIRMVDVLGREIFRTSFIQEEGKHRQQIDVNHVGPGIYLMEIRVADKTSSHSDFVVIEKIQIIR